MSVETVLTKQIPVGFELLLWNDHYDPHSILGLHDFENKKVIRLWRPGAPFLYLNVKGKKREATKLHDAGLFELVVDAKTKAKDYQVYHQDGSLAHDPYCFLPSFGELDQYLFSKGVHYEIYQAMGGRLSTQEGIEGCKFSVWAPSAKSVSLVSDFNHWDGRSTPMRSLGSSGVWEIFIPAMKEGQKYKFEIKTQCGERLIKSDPYALSSELRPKTASVIANLNRFEWSDQAWMQKRIDQKDSAKPMSVYELHLGSWNMQDGNYLNYREIAARLASYCQHMGFTHVELMPISEHPLDESWGYQITGFYAASSRYGSPEDFQYFVNHMHNQGIGVIMDWVPAHFPSDSFSLRAFDGTSLYEHSDMRQGYHPHWNTCIFNYGRHEVSNFLIANALFWFEKMHIDGLRVDAVASMLYLDYGREDGDWIPNQYGGKENIEAIEFMRHLNSVVHDKFPGILMIAEESTSFSGVTRSVQEHGLGFDMKWNMGWMNDTLTYFQKDPIYRHYHHNELTFGLLYAFSERFALVLSHDEVVHGKRSLLDKMPGDLWQRFANLRLLYSYMVCQPGKNLLFMGGELGQWEEWSCKKEIEWHLLQYPAHKGIQEMVKDLNHFYLQNPALWEKDFDHTGFEWVDFHDVENSVISYYRKGENSYLLCMHNFTPNYHDRYFLRMPNLSSASLRFNTDSATYGGSAKDAGQIKIVRSEDGRSEGMELSIPPLSTMIFDITHE